MRCTRLAANTGRKSREKSPSRHHLTTLSGYIFATKACIDNRKKNLLNSNICFTCPHNMVNFGLLAAEIVSLVWGIPGNFNGFCVLVALLHGTLVVGVSQTAALNRGRQLYSAGRPSGWALAHISSFICFTYRCRVSGCVPFGYLCRRYCRCYGPYVIGQTIIFMVALCNRADRYIFILFLSSSFFFLFFPRLISAVGE